MPKRPERPERTLRRETSADRGATTLEYGFLISLIAAVVALVLTPFAAAVLGLFQEGLAAFP